MKTKDFAVCKVADYMVHYSRWFPASPLKIGAAGDKRQHVAYALYFQRKGTDMLRFIAAGESHGKALAGILEGLPGDLAVDREYIDLQLHRRQLGYGRGERMKIEKDRVEILSGVRHGKTLGSPIAFIIENKDWASWRLPMNEDPVASEVDTRPVYRPRPGHADLPGAIKFHTHDIRNILERASARETASRVAAGSFCRLLLAHFGVRIGSHVLAIGKEEVPETMEYIPAEKVLGLDSESAIRCAESADAAGMMRAIDEARAAGDSIGGVLETVAVSVPPGLGSHIQWDRKLDGRIAQAMMSIPSAKAVEIGTGVSGSRKPGSEFHDEISYNRRTRRFFRKTNRAGGIEGGITNGEDIRVRVFLKPIPTLRKALGSVDLQSKAEDEAAFERSDTCVVPAAGVIAESMLGYILADAFLEKFGGDSMAETESNYAHYQSLMDAF